GGGVCSHVAAEEHGHDLVADEFVHIAMPRRDLVGDDLEIEVEELDDLGRVARVGEGGVAADIGEEDRYLAPLAAEADAIRRRPLDRRDGAAGDEFGELEALIDLPDHGVDALGELADLVMRADILDARMKIAARHLDRRLADLEDRPADAEGEDDGAERRRGEAEGEPQAEAAD